MWNRVFPYLVHRSAASMSAERMLPVLTSNDGADLGAVNCCGDRAPS
jgi:hypothetical protein